jgi:hypothetical protein
MNEDLKFLFWVAFVPVLVAAGLCLLLWRLGL